MNSGLIGKIEKAKRYAEERTRIHVSGLKVDFDGENFFVGWGACAHTMALERILEGMLPKSALHALPA